MSAVDSGCPVFGIGIAKAGAGAGALEQMGSKVRRWMGVTPCLRKASQTRGPMVRLGT